MKHYTVAATIQSRDLSNPPATVTYYKGGSLASAMSALATAAASVEETSENMPESVRYDVLAVTLTVTESTTP